MMPAIPRRRRALPATIAAIVLSAAGVTVVIDVIAAHLAGGSLVWPQRAIAAQLRAAQWNSTAILVIAAAVTALGLLLALAALTPGRRTLIRLRSDDPAFVVGTSRRNLRRSLTDAARDVDGIAKAKAKPHRHTVKVKATSQLRDPGNQRDKVHAAVHRRLQALGPAGLGNVKVKIKRKEA
jgi:hypothetical protein